MREILFKAKRLYNGEWVEGHYIPIEENAYIVVEASTECMDAENTDFYAVEWYQVDPDTVCQFTGPTDKNGKKIFEGDICKHRSNYSGDFIISVVTFTDGQFLVMADNNSGFNLSEKLEVIGNIHDNPELVEGGVTDET